jgi:hypothetical protein
MRENNKRISSQGAYEMVSTHKKAVAVIILCALSLLIHQSAQAAPVNITVTVKTSPDSQRQTRLTVKNNKIAESIARKGIRTAVRSIPVSDCYLTINGGGEKFTYVMDPSGGLYDEPAHERIDVPEAAKTGLRKIAESLRSKHYGKLVGWDKADALLPLKMKFKVIDMETGLAFNVQRRAGKDHADVQPLTKADTAVMKRIYNGKWSWRRKAILVQTDTQLLAASMHGMPHGGDGIPDNNFSGHFCIHFLGSSVHGSGSIDPAHQLMAHKAAGKLDGYLDNASPYEVADSFFTAVNAQESQILKMLLVNGDLKELQEIIDDNGQMITIRKRSDFALKEFQHLLRLDIPVETGIIRKSGREEKMNLTVEVIRLSPMEPWKIAAVRP